MTIIEQIAPLSVINAVGYATRVGGSRPSTEVLAAMWWAQEHYFELDDLLNEASGIIARETGSQGGLVTCSASAALTLGAAAILTGNDLGAMEALPDTSALVRRQFLYPRHNDYDYDHPIRASGAALIPFSFEGDDLEMRLGAAINEQTAGVIYVWRSRQERSLIERIGRFCRAAKIPFLLDAAMGLPPAENLRDFYQLGPNLVALSGGKHLEGPQNSGLLFGDADLVTSAWLQMVDMDVRPISWSLARLIADGTIPRPPRHGIGRGFKVGKDAILGCLTALSAYPKRDFIAEAERWKRICNDLGAALCSNEDFQIESLPTNGTGQYPVVRITARNAERMAWFKNQLKHGSPKIVTAEDEESEETTYLYPMCLPDSAIPPLIGRINELLRP